MDSPNEQSMILRMWHGWTTPQNAAAYEGLVLGDVFPGIAARGIPGYRGASLSKRVAADEVAFVTMLWFDSEEDIRAFAGPDSEAAFVPPPARAILSRFDERAAHFVTVVPPPAGLSACGGETS